MSLAPKVIYVEAGRWLLANSLRNIRYQKDDAFETTAANWRRDLAGQAQRSNAFSCLGGVGMANGRMRVDRADDWRSPTDWAKEAAKYEAIAAELCAAVFLKGKVLGRFAMLLDELPEATGLPRADVQAVIDLAIDRDWFRLGHSYIELQASGIYVAKEMLDLLR